MPSKQMDKKGKGVVDTQGQLAIFLDFCLLKGLNHIFSIFHLLYIFVLHSIYFYI